MLICVTNRKLCRDDFLYRIEQLGKGKPCAIMLREKDLDLTNYESLAVKVKEICESYQVPLIISQNVSTASKLKLRNIHLSMDNLRIYKDNLNSFTYVGASVHSVAEAIEAQELGATTLTAGHIFTTDCKKGVPARGLLFLEEVCHSVKIPVYGIGGITKENAIEVVKTGAKGICIMSEAMTCKNPQNLIKSFGF